MIKQSIISLFYCIFPLKFAQIQENMIKRGVGFFSICNYLCLCNMQM